MPIHKVKGGYKWGGHGHVYPSRKGAERQAAAAYAHGYKGKAVLDSLQAVRYNLTKANVLRYQAITARLMNAQKGWDKASHKKWWRDIRKAGTFEDCQRRMEGHVDDTGAFCAWAEHEGTGHWPAEKAAPVFMAEVDKAGRTSRSMPTPANRGGLVDHLTAEHGEHIKGSGLSFQDLQTKHLRGMHDFYHQSNAKHTHTPTSPQVQEEAQPSGHGHPQATATPAKTPKRPRFKSSIKDTPPEAKPKTSGGKPKTVTMPADRAALLSHMHGDHGERKDLISDIGNKKLHLLHSQHHRGGGTGHTHTGMAEGTDADAAAARTFAQNIRAKRKERQASTEAQTTTKTPSGTSTTPKAERKKDDRPQIRSYYDLTDEQRAKHLELHHGLPPDKRATPGMLGDIHREHHTGAYEDWQRMTTPHRHYRKGKDPSMQPPVTTRHATPEEMKRGLGIAKALQSIVDNAGLAGPGATPEAAGFSPEQGDRRNAVAANIRGLRGLGMRGMARQHRGEYHRDPANYDVMAEPLPEDANIRPDAVQQTYRQMRENAPAMHHFGVPARKAVNALDPPQRTHTKIVRDLMELAEEVPA